MSDTLDYYENNAEAFIDTTFNVSMGEVYQEFLPAIPEAGHILDAGCGSGRDALYFSKLGFQVSAFDGSAAIAALASQKTGLGVQHRLFSQIVENHSYDGIWACASLLHLSLAEIPDALLRLWLALKYGGTLYLSFKVGVGERHDGRRHFTDADESVAEQWIDGLLGLDSCRMWRTGSAARS